MYLIIYSFIFTGWAFLDNQVDCIIANLTNFTEWPKKIEFASAPYLVLVYVMKTGVRCTGSVIADKFILTAAHCYIGTQKFLGTRVYYGRTNFTEADLINPYTKFMDAVDVLIHPHYAFERLGTASHADIAIIELVKSITDDEDNLMRILTLGGSWPYDDDYDLMIMGCVVLGFGYDVGPVNVTQLYRAEVAANHDHTLCRCVSKNIICTRDPNVVFCRGQSAYPLICKRRIFGIASYHVERRHCRAPRNLQGFQENSLCLESIGTVFTFICPFLVWINEILEIEEITAAPYNCKAHLIHSNTYIIYIFSVFIIAYMW